MYVVDDYPTVCIMRTKFHEEQIYTHTNVQTDAKMMQLAKQNFQRV